MGHRVLTLIFLAALIALPLHASALGRPGDQGASGQYQQEEGVIEELTEEASRAPDEELNIKYGGEREGVVTKVIDSARLMIDGERVELIGVTAPGPKDCFADESTAYVAARVLGKKVTYSGEQVDDHERRLGDRRVYVYTSDSMLNSEIIRKGMGFADRRPGYPEEEAFADLQVAARRKHMGLWHTCPVECDRFGDCKAHAW